MNPNEDVYQLSGCFNDSGGSFKAQKSKIKILRYRPFNSKFLCLFYYNRNFQSVITRLLHIEIKFYKKQIKAENMYIKTLFMVI
jgi:hypothetical protein